PDGCEQQQNCRANVGGHRRHSGRERDIWWCATAEQTDCGEARVRPTPRTARGFGTRLLRGHALLEPRHRIEDHHPMDVVVANHVHRMMIFNAMARLKQGVTPQQASAEATSRARSGPDPGLAAVGLFGSGAPPDITLTPAVAAMTTDVRSAILLLLAAVGLLLVTAT